jgi:hypothetical protein
MRSFSFVPAHLLVPPTMLLLLLAGISGCTGSSRGLDGSKTPGDFLAELPPVMISPTAIVHSPNGDMSARIPHEWILIDATQLEMPEVFAVACDPDYTMSLVFSETPVDDAARRGYRSSGVRGLAEAGFQRRRARSADPIQLVGQIEEFAIGRRLFSAYTYSSDSMHTITRAAVFITDSHMYECAITHLTFSGKDLPDQPTIRDIHQLVLGTIEW